MKKITNDDLTNKGVVGLPDVPGLPYPEMQRKFDEIGKEVLVPKFNELIDDLSGLTGALQIGVINPFVFEYQPDAKVQDALNSAYEKYKELDEKIGEVDGSLVEYVDGKIETTEGHINSFAESFDMRISKVEEAKVDVEPGKGLSQNDFSNEYVEKISDLETTKHTHENKSVLDTITSTLLSAYNRLLTLFGTITELDKASLTDDDSKIPTSKAVVNYISGKDGVMLKSVYDKNNDGVVDTAKEAYLLNYFGNTYSAGKFFEEIEKTQKNTYFIYPIQTTVNSYEGGLGVMDIDGYSYQSGANGKNLLPFTPEQTSVSGITVTKNADGTLVVNGTATAIVNIRLHRGTLANGTYKIVGIPSGLGEKIFMHVNNYANNSGISGPSYYSGKTFAVTDGGLNIYLRVEKDATIVNALLKPMLSADTSVTYADYEPCIAPSQPQPIHSVGDMGCVDLGSLTWQKYTSGSNWIFYASVPNGRTNVGSGNKVSLIVDNGYLTSAIAMGGTASASSTDKTISWDATNSQILIKDTSYTEATDFKTAMKGVKLLYEVADGQTPSQYGMAIKESNKNLLVPTLTSTTNNGVTATRNSDGTYTLNGTATANAYLTIAQNISLKAGTYKLVCAENPSTSTYRCYINAPSEIASDTTNDGVFTLNEDKTCTFMFKVNSGESFSNTIIKPMISTDTTATYNSYVQHEEKATIIPLSAPLRKIGDAEDFIDVKNGKTEREFASVDLGSLTWVKSQQYANGYYYTDLDVDTEKVDYVSALCSRYTINKTSKDFNGMSDGQMVVCYKSLTSKTRVYIVDNTITSVSDAQTKLSGIMLIYKTDVSTIEPLTDEQKSALAELVTYAGQTTLDLTVGLNEMVYPQGMFYYGSSDVVAQTIKNTNDNIILNAKLNKLLNQ